MTIAIVLGVLVFLAVAAVFSIQTSKTKKRAIADLEAEKENVGAFDIFELVESEVNALRLTDIQGAADIPHGVLLKVWSESEDVVDSCGDDTRLRYVVTPGISPADAADEDVTLECKRT